jgi:hypothetical protein
MGCLAVILSAQADDVSVSKGGDFFTTKVHPVLEAKCFGCHGEEKDREGELDMRSREGLLKGGESGNPALVPGKPDESPMFRAVLRTEKLKMPPKERNALSAGEIESLREWIAAGALWSEPAKAEKKWEYKEEDVWAFKPRTLPAVPQIANRKSPIVNPIDAFIQQKLSEKNLKPAPPADKLTLIRRATFDLIGLPPTPEEIEAFMNDKSPEAFDKIIERLLASPHYGEKWGRHWLDIVRYADTDGFSNDFERPNAWRYRDYVIRSFNRDKPYNEFIMEQVAGDEIDPKDPEKVIATGMLRMGPWEQTAMSVAAVTRQQFLDDVTAQIGAAYLGLTIGCAKCHDHKFDPIPTKDYYRLQSVFAPTQFAQRKMPFLPEENAAEFEKQIAAVKEAMKPTQEKLKALKDKREKAIQEYLKEKGVEKAGDLPEDQRPKVQFGITTEEFGKQKAYRKRLDYYERELQRYRPQVYSVASGGLETKVETPTLHVLIGGSIESPGEPVTPGLLSAVHNSDDTKMRNNWNTVTDATEGRRLALAKWIASAEHPLTARVMVNRIWQHHFGKGIVKSSNNFGKMGDKPTHPELLDWLANYFVEHGWSVKEMHRLMMQSHTYQQSSAHPDMKVIQEIDPEEKLLARFLPRRLTAEEIRDSMLLVSGELSEATGGPGVFPDINLEAALQPRHIMGGMAPVYKPSLKREERSRRSIYSFQIRTLPNPMLEVFNAANLDISCERRDSTTVTPQVFALFNSQPSYDRAFAMAKRLEESSGDQGKKIEQAFQIAYGRLPTKAEKRVAARHLDEMTKQHRSAGAVDFELPKSVERQMVEELTGEPFTMREDWEMKDYEPNIRPSELSPETRALAELCLVIMNANEFAYVY